MLRSDFFEKDKKGLYGFMAIPLKKSLKTKTQMNSISICSM